MVDTTGINIYLEGGVIQEITGIPEGEKVTVIDRDTEGIESNRLTKLDGVEVLVTTWDGKQYSPRRSVDDYELRGH